MKGGKEAEKTSLPEKTEGKRAFSAISLLCRYDGATGSGDRHRSEAVYCTRRSQRGVTRYTRQGHAVTHPASAGRQGIPGEEAVSWFSWGQVGNARQTGSTGITSVDPEGCSLPLVAI